MLPTLQDARGAAQPHSVSGSLAPSRMGQPMKPPVAQTASPILQRQLPSVIGCGVADDGQPQANASVARRTSMGPLSSRGAASMSWAKAVAASAMRFNGLVAQRTATRDTMITSKERQ